MGCLIFGLIVVGALAVGGYFVWQFISDEVLPEIEEATDVFDSFIDAPAGPCYDLEVSDGILTGWTEVSCDGARQIEVSLAAELDDGPFPGGNALDTQAATTCSNAFESYVGVAHEDSIFDVQWLMPSETNWADGDRQGICLIVADDGSDLTGIVKDSNR